MPSWLPYSTYLYLDFHLLFHDKTKRTQQGNLLGTSWMAIREKIFKYFDAQKVIQQISIFFKSIFHIGADCQKGYFEFFSVNDFICHSQKFQLWQTPPSRYLPICPRFFDKYQIFFIKYLGSVRPLRTWLMCVWSKFSKK